MVARFYAFTFLGFLVALTLTEFVMR